MKPYTTVQLNVKVSDTTADLNSFMKKRKEMWRAFVYWIEIISLTSMLMSK